MQIRINQALPLRTNKDKSKYVVLEVNISRLVWNGKHMIMVIDNGRGGHVLNVQYKREGYSATLPTIDADQAARCAPAFFEAIKAGRDSFEVNA